MMKKYVILIGVLVFSHQAYGASFDCGKAKTLVEHAICSDKQLSILDELLMTSYKKALAYSSDPSTLKTTQREWLKSERDSCKDVDCLKQAYTLRLSALDEPIASTQKPSSGKPAPSSQTIVIPAVDQTNPDEGIIKRNNVEISGKIVFGHDAAGGNFWINGGKGKQYTMAYVGTVEDDIQTKIWLLIDNETRVTVKGVLRYWKDGSAGFDNSKDIYIFVKP
jgi:uncharacterized protein